MQLDYLRMFYPVLMTWCLVTSSVADYLPFRDPDLPFQERVEDLVSRLTLDEMINQTMTTYKGPTPAIPRLGINSFVYITECLAGQKRTNSTSYPQPIGLAATFSPEMIERKSFYTGNEMRALWNENVKHGVYTNNHGLSCFSPVLNIFRHPLWGRGQETFGEDPYLTSQMGIHFVKGLQGYDPRINKANAGCKHFDVHGGPENIPSSRFTFNSKVSVQDWRMTFLPAFKSCVDAGAVSLMCSYNSINGVPACANKKLLRDISRGEWGFKGFVVSDDLAIPYIKDKHHYCENYTCVVKAALTAGCNLELGTNVYNHIKQAIKEKLITEELVRESMKPLFLSRMKLGEFDPPGWVPYDDLDMSEIQKAEHRELSISLAAMSFVLLKNTNATLPVTKKLAKLAVIGPFANGNIDKIYGWYSSNFAVNYTKTPYEALKTLANNTSTASGCNDPQCANYDSTDVINSISGSDLIVVCLGTGTDIEREGNDRSDLNLPGIQINLLKDAVAHGGGAPVVLLLFNAGPLDITWAKVHPGVAAIFACSFPAQATGDAVYRVMTGTGAGGIPAARLPITWPAYLNQVPPITDYNMSGHTYRYYKGTPLYPFGYGLSYTRFNYTLLDAPDTVVTGEDITVFVGVKNIGDYDADEVVQLYLSWDNASLPAPKLQLVGFQRVRVNAGRDEYLMFTVTPQQMALWLDDEQGFVQLPGAMVLYAGGQQPNQATEVPSNVLRHLFRVVPRRKITEQSWSWTIEVL